MVNGYVCGRALDVLLVANAHLSRAEIDEACAAGDQALDLCSRL
jgi:3-hydroxy-3-methylglutaryl CoA synthase